MTNYQGQLTDGGEPRMVAVIPAPHGLEVDGAWWSFDSVDVQRDGSRMRFQHVDAVLTMDDVAFTEALGKLNAKVARGEKEGGLPEFALRIGLIGVAFCALIAAAFWWGIPLAVNLIVRVIPTAMEEKLGHAAIAMMAPQRCVDPSVRTIAETLEKGGAKSAYRFRVYVVEDPQVNAFALPGGSIVIYRGLLERTRRPEEAAAVIAHEMQHVLRRHSMRAMVRDASIAVLWALVAGNADGAIAQLAGSLGATHYQRGDEASADREGLRMMEAARIDARAMVSMLEMLQKAGGDEPAVARYFSTHPLTRDRIDRVRERINGNATHDALLAGIPWPPPKAACLVGQVSRPAAGSPDPAWPR